MKIRFLNLLVEFLAGTPVEYVAFKPLIVLLRKLCVTLVALAIHCHPKGLWKDFLKELFSVFDPTQSNVIPESMQTFASITGNVPLWKRCMFLMELWKSFADEFAALARVLSPQQRAALEDEIRSFSPTVLQFCEYLLRLEPASVDVSVDIELLKLSALRCITSWINYGTRLE